METSQRSGVFLSWRAVARLSLAAILILPIVSAGTWWAANMRWIAKTRQSMASHHAFEVRSAERVLLKLDAGALPEADIPGMREWLNQRISFHKDREQRYLDAAAKPWSKEPEYATPPSPIPVHLLSQAAD